MKSHRAALKSSLLPHPADGHSHSSDGGRAPVVGAATQNPQVKVKRAEPPGFTPGKHRRSRAAGRLRAATMAISCVHAQPQPPPPPAAAAAAGVQRWQRKSTPPPPIDVESGAAAASSEEEGEEYDRHVDQAYAAAYVEVRPAAAAQTLRTALKQNFVRTALPALARRPTW